MERTFRTERLDASRPADLERAAELLRAGETVAFPTETVYGLGANALDPAAVERIFVAKQRPHWDPLIVHVCDEAMLAQAAQVHASERKLIAAFWPGPLTLLLERTSAIPNVVTAGRPRVGVRIPAHPVARRLLELAGVPIAAPSANRFGHTSPTSARHVLDDLDGRIAAVLDGGETTVGVESTVAEVTVMADLRTPLIVIYRPGGVSAGMLEELAIGPVEYFVAPFNSAPESLPSPGVGLRHYAPRARLLLVDLPGQSEAMQALALMDAVEQAVEAGALTGVMLPDDWSASTAKLIFPWGAWGDERQLAHRLYQGLRQLDERNASTIICPVPRAGGLNDAIRDRLFKARAV